MPNNRERLRRSQPETNRKWTLVLEPHIAEKVCNGLGKKYHLNCRKLSEDEIHFLVLEGRVAVEINLESERMNTDFYTEIAFLRTNKNPLELKPNY